MESEKEDEETEGIGKREIEGGQSQGKSVASPLTHQMTPIKALQTRPCRKLFKKPQSFLHYKGKQGEKKRAENKTRGRQSKGEKAKPLP